MTEIILADMAPVAEELASGAIAVVGESVRVRRLPSGPGSDTRSLGAGFAQGLAVDDLRCHFLHAG